MDLLLETQNAEGDLALGAGDLAQDFGLQSAVLLSLFTDARNPETEAGSDPRGWWGDLAGDEWGSLLWTLDRQVASKENANNARQYAEASLAWMREDGIVERVEVAAGYVRPGYLELVVKLIRGNATEWAHAWREYSGDIEFGGGILRLSAA